MWQISVEQIREAFHHKGLALTHQRQVIYESILGSHGHPSPEEVYQQVRARNPSICLATVYNTIKTFLDAGLLQEVSVHHGSMRVDGNLHPHHHLVCTGCRQVHDIDEKVIGPVRLRRRLPRGFKVQRYSVDILGLCDSCRKAKK